MTPECTAAWRNYECKVNVTGYERRTQDAFVAGWQAATDAAVNTTALALEAAITSVNTAHNVLTPAVGHVCVGPPSSRKPGLCWICGQFLPHDCVGGAQPIGATQGSVTVSPAGANVLIGTIHDQPRFLVERADVADLIARLVRAYVDNASVTHGPPRRFNGSTPPTVAAHSRALAELHDAAEALANRLAGAGRKWPIGTPDGTVYGSAYSTADEWHLRLRAARTHWGLTLDALARRLDPPRTRKDISAMEHGRRGLSVELCAQLADALDCDRLWLAGWTL